MWTKALFCFVLIMASAPAAVYLLSPAYTQLAEKSYMVEGVAPGHELVLIFSKSGADFEWDTITVTSGPQWQYWGKADSKNMYVKIDIPKEEKPGVFTLAMQFTNRIRLQNLETLELKVRVTGEHLFSASNLKSESELFADRDYGLLFNVKNNAVAKTDVEVELLPNPLIKDEWIKKRKATYSLEPGQTAQASLLINVPEHGRYPVDIKVRSLTNPNMEETIGTTLIAKPTISSKLKSIANGFPLIPVVMSQFYALIGFLGI